jgi:hypothetical protein
MIETLLQFEKIIEELDMLFLDVPIESREALSDMTLKQPGLSLDKIAHLKNILKTNIPESFLEIIQQYDFGDFALGDVNFDDKKNYTEFLIKWNTGINPNLYGHYWWGTGERPSNYLLIADSDGFMILLDTETEKILAYARTESYRESKTIAANFSLFVRAAATIYINLLTIQNKDLLIDIPALIGSDKEGLDFWEEQMLDI